jgi:hypothetical protein
LLWIGISHKTEKAGQMTCLKLFIRVRPARLERATSCFVGKRSIQLSYGRKCKLICASLRLSDYCKGFRRVSTKVNFERILTEQKFVRRGD